MCNRNCLVWGRQQLQRDDAAGKRVLEIGSLDVNGSLRGIVQSLAPAEYVGVDIREGPGVDVICRVEDVVARFGPESFDLVISTCTLEHVRDWKCAVSNIKNVCKAGGIILLIVPAVWPYHEYPCDFWRYSEEDIKQIFSDCRILTLEKDRVSPALVYAKIRKPERFQEKDLSSYLLYSMISQRSVLEILDRHVLAFRVISWWRGRMFDLKGMFAKMFFPARIRMQRFVLNQFHKRYYAEHVDGVTRAFWLGRPVLKCPLDLWVFQEIIFELKPDLIVECGTGGGGSALFLAGMCDLAGHGQVVTIDSAPQEDRPQHPRIRYLAGSSTAEEVVAEVRRLAEGLQRVMAILDSDHHKPHVLRELELYSQFVTPGSYLIVEDTNINRHPVFPAFGPGPMEAVQEFLPDHRNFEIDETREKFFLTYNPKGYLKRIS